MDFPYSASKAQNTECTEIKRAYVRVENGEWRACLYIPRKVFFYVWLTAMPPLVKAPLWQQLFCFNGPVLCQRGKFFTKKGCHMWLRGWYHLPLVFYSPQCGAGASWRAADSQSSVQLALKVGRGRGELDCDGWCWDAFSYWPESGPQRELSGELHHKHVSIWPINTAENGYLCLIGL